MDLKGLVHRELGEGLTEEELASTVGVSVETIANILADELPQDRTTWEHFARYFRVDVDFLQIRWSATLRGTVRTHRERPSLPPRPDEEGATPEVGSDRSDDHARRAASCHPS